MSTDYATTSSTVKRRHQILVTMATRSPISLIKSVYFYPSTLGVRECESSSGTPSIPLWPKSAIVSIRSIIMSVRSTIVSVRSTSCPSGQPRVCQVNHRVCQVNYRICQVNHHVHQVKYRVNQVNYCVGVGRMKSLACETSILLDQRTKYACSQRSSAHFQYGQTVKSHSAVRLSGQTVQVTVKIS